MRSYSLLSYLLCVLILGGLTGCRDDRRVHEVDLSRRVPADQIRMTPPRQELRVAVSAMLSAERTFDSYHALLQYLGAQLQMPITFKQRRTYEEVNLLLERGQLDLAFICSGAYIVLAEQAPIEIMGVPLIDGKATYQSYIIVPTGSPVRSLEDLRGARFAFTDPLSNTGKLYATYRLAQIGTTPDEFFAGYSYTNSHDHSIQTVAQQHVDGGSVDSRIFQLLSESSPELIEQVRIIEESPPLAMPPIVFGTSVPEALRDKIRQILFRIHETPGGQKLLAPLHFDRFVPIDDAAYDPIREMRKLAQDGGSTQTP